MFSAMRQAFCREGFLMCRSLIGLTAALFLGLQNGAAPPLPLSKHLEIDLGGVKLKTFRIEAGSFTMGSPENEANRIDNETQHKVVITKPFYMGVYLVTQAQYQRIMGKNPSDFSAQGAFKDRIRGMSTEEFPVESVSWDEAQEFCKRVTELPALRARKLTCALPTEAQWEYACRAGTKTAYWFGDAISKERANYGSESESGRTTKVGSFPANPWGLYDMHGNVRQWCADGYQKDYYALSPLRDPAGPEADEQYLVLRGGAYNVEARHCRSAYRDSLSGRGLDNIGFRVVVRVP
jgi:formylglycine-generating enzyme required for sulfatase activity